MIVVCKKCYTPFLVPDSLLTEHGKTVKCGKCGNKWVEVPIKKNSFPQKNIKEVFMEPQRQIIKHATNLKEQIRKESKEALTAKNLYKQLKNLALFFGILSLIFCIAFLSAHKYIIAEYPELQKVYISIGWVKEEREALILKDIKSKRAYKDGAMHLIVKGKILCIAKKTQVIPDIKADAIGVDGSLIESWRITPQRATLETGRLLSFKSVRIAPKGTVTKINLSFVEQPRDKDE